jgi:hypothetical protein
MYAKVALSLTVLEPSAGSLMEHVNQGWLKIWQKHLQPGIHEVDARLATSIEHSIHGDFPETGKLWLTLAQAVAVKTIVCHPIVKCVRPESIGIIFRNGDRSARTRVISEANGSEMFQSVGGIVQIRCTETNDIRKRNASKCVKSDEVAIDLIVGWCTNMSHAMSGVN